MVHLLLAMIVERITGQPIELQLRNRIFRPLGLERTSYTSSSRIVGSHAHGYLMLDDQTRYDVTDWSPTVFGAAAAILTSADDLAHFYRELLRGRLVRPNVLDAMTTIDPVATGGIPDAGSLGGGWGLGILRENMPCGEAWGHDAENPGYMTAAWNSRDATRQVVVIVNSNHSHDEPVSEKMRKVITLAYCGR